MTGNQVHARVLNHCRNRRAPAARWRLIVWKLDLWRSRLLTAASLSSDTGRTRRGWARLRAQRMEPPCQPRMRPVNWRCAFGRRVARARERQLLSITARAADLRPAQEQSIEDEHCGPREA